jgi:hypothetical protein
LVTIIGEDEPGLFGFADGDAHVRCDESSGCARLVVSRFNGSSGFVTVEYATAKVPILASDAHRL